MQSDEQSGTYRDHKKREKLTAHLAPEMFASGSGADLPHTIFTPKVPLVCIFIGRIIVVLSDNRICLLLVGLSPAYHQLGAPSRVYFRQSILQADGKRSIHRESKIQLLRIADFKRMQYMHGQQQVHDWSMREHEIGEQKQACTYDQVSLKKSLGKGSR